MLKIMVYKWYLNKVVFKKEIYCYKFYRKWHTGGITAMFNIVLDNLHSKNTHKTKIIIFNPLNIEKILVNYLFPVMI